MNRQTLRTILKIITAVLVIAIVGVIIFSFVQWIRDEPNSYEPINAFAFAALSAVMVASGWFASKLRDNEPRPPTPPEPAPAGTPVNITPLYRQMDQALGLDDVHDLCFDLSFDYENLAGETKKAKIRSLIREMQRNGRMPELTSALTAVRPQFRWDAPTAVLPQDVRVRQQFLQNVRSTWVDGILHQSLSSAIAIELNLTYQHDATTQKTIYIPGQEERAVEKPVIEVFEDYARSLLILGDPGSGKTITLLQLAEELIKEAQADPGEKAPIVLNLSSWANEKRPLTEWLVEEIFLNYGLSREIGKRWIANNQLLYLLDGLDEVAEDARDACVDEINSFRANAHHAIEMVVCSRIKDYEALSNKLSMGTAVTIQPLDEAQIEAYLGRDDLELKAVRASLNHDSDLQELTKSPLMLNIMTLAYRGMDEKELRASFGLVEKRREHLFDTYIAEMFKRRPLASDRYDKDQAQHWLVNLAYGMQEHGQSLFYIERLQPTWLPSNLLQSPPPTLNLLIEIENLELVEVIQWRKKAWILFVKAIRRQLIALFIGGLIVGLIFGLVGGIGLIEGMRFGMVYAAVYGLFFAIIPASVGMIKKREINQRSSPNQGIHSSYRNSLKMGLILGLIGGIIFGPLFGLIAFASIAFFYGLSPTGVSLPEINEMLISGSFI